MLSPKKIIKTIKSTLITSVFINMLMAAYVQGNEVIDSSEKVSANSYTKKGADTCIKCHDEDNNFPVFPIFKTKHGQPADLRTPFANLQCESCHGAGKEHAKETKIDQPQAPILSYAKHSSTSATEQNKPCLNCHENHQRISWKGSIHESNDVRCVDCHNIHTEKDDVLTQDKQPNVCFQCHTKERAETYKSSAHPIRYGQMNCSDCHNTHGNFTPNQLTKNTLNETCYTCHAEKRGPVLWEHAPVTEDCSICHVPHGSNHPALLKKRTVLLCKECHSQEWHPSLTPNGNVLPGNSGEFFNRFSLVNGCLNCHSRVHGSNHPSGMKLVR